MRKQELLLKLKRRAAPSPQELEIQRLRAELDMLKSTLQPRQEQSQSVRRPTVRVPPLDLVVLDSDSDVES